MRCTYLASLVGDMLSASKPGPYEQSRARRVRRGSRAKIVQRRWLGRDEASHLALN